MAEAARLEPIWQEYSDQDVTFMGIDVYDGAPDQVDLLFRKSGRTSFPLLLMGSMVARTFKSNIEYALVIDHQGVVQYHAYGVSGREPKIREVLAGAVKAVATAQEAEQEPVEDVKGPVEASWGGVKEGANGQ